jgi:hypothetical protein
MTYRYAGVEDDDFTPSRRLRVSEHHASDSARRVSELKRLSGLGHAATGSGSGLRSRGEETEFYPQRTSHRLSSGNSGLKHEYTGYNDGHDEYSYRPSGSRKHLRDDDEDERPSRRIGARYDDDRDRSRPSYSSRFASMQVNVEDLLRRARDRDERNNQDRDDGERRTGTVSRRLRDVQEVRDESLRRVTTIRPSRNSKRERRY